MGARIRRRRLFLGVTQAALARALGVTFQQVQKYENGVNRVPPRRLARIALCLEVAPDYFDGSGPDLADGLERFAQSPEGLTLYRAMAQIGDVAERRRLIVAVAAFSDSIACSEESAADPLPHWLRQIASQNQTGRQKKMVANALHALKVELAQRIGHTLKARKLTQKFAAGILGTDQARISALANGNVEAASLEKLLRYMVLLGWDVGITAGKRPIDARARIEFVRRTDESSQ